jgi:hypothetical protein
MASCSDCSGEEWPAALNAQEENGLLQMENGQLLRLLRRRMASCFDCSGGEWPAASAAQEKNGQLLLLLK